MNSKLAPLFDLSVEEKLQLVEDLWDDIASNPEDVPVHPWQLQELERRRAHHEAHPENALSWEEVKQKIRSKYGR